MIDEETDEPEEDEIDEPEEEIAEPEEEIDEDFVDRLTWNDDDITILPRDRE